MEAIATQKFIKMSPKKIRQVALLVKRISPEAAIKTLPLLRKAAAEPLLKVIKAAIANAKSKGAGNLTDLIFKEIQVGEGPRLKRGRAGGRGRWKPYKRRMSHIRVVLTEKEKKNGAKS